MTRPCFSFCSSLLAATLAAATLHADPIAVKHVQGATRGFLTIRSETGAYLGTGDLTQTATGDRVTSRTIFRFQDGSIDDETVVYTQRGVFKLVSDHHIQKGPFFKEPMDVTIDVAAGTVTSHTVEKDGKEKGSVEHKDMRPDLVNGFISTMLTNVARDAAFKVSMIAGGAKSRTVELKISPDGEQSFRIAGIARKASIFRVHIELGGVAGVVAPMIGKQPDDVMVWLVPGEAPGVVRVTGQLAEGGQWVSIELAGATFTHTAAKK